MQNTDRLGSLERRVRWLQGYAAVATAFLLISATTTPGAARFDVVTAERFIVLDENGASRAVLGMQVEHGTNYITGEEITGRIPTRESYVALRLTGEDTSARLVVPDKDEPYLELIEDDERAVVRSDSFRLREEGDKSGSEMTLDMDGLVLDRDWDDDEESSSERIELGFDEGLSIRKRFADDDGTVGWSAGVYYHETDERPFLFVDNEEDDTVWKAP